CRSPPPPSPTPFPYTTLFRSGIRANRRLPELVRGALRRSLYRRTQLRDPDRLVPIAQLHLHPHLRDTLLHAVGRARETEPGSVGAREIRYCERDTQHGEGCRRSEEHTSELQSRENLVCRLLLEKKK